MDKPHKKLDVWKLSMELSRAIYRLTAGFPGEERFGLVSQMRRAAVSVPSSLAERKKKGPSRPLLVRTRAALTRVAVDCD